MFIQLHMIGLFVLFMKHQNVHTDRFMWTKISYVWINFGYCHNLFLKPSRALATKANSSGIMERQNIEWSSTPKEPYHCLRYFDYIQDWPQKIMESETSLIFQASTPKSKMKPYMILKSTEAIAAQSAFPRRATVLFRRVSHYIRYNSCVWRRWWRWFRKCLGSSDHALSHCHLKKTNARSEADSLSKWHNLMS